MRATHRIIKGVGISPGIALGRTRIVLKGEAEVSELPIPASKVPAELELLDQAVADTLEELRALRQTAGKKVAGPLAKIFDAQLMIAGDYEFLKQVKELIADQRRNAAFAYHVSVKQTTTPLKQSADQYMQQMAVDIDAVASRVLSHLAQEQKPEETAFPPDTILAGRMFSPGDVISYRQRKVSGFITAEGGRNSHMALIARSLLLPIVMAESGWTQIPEDARVIVDGTEGLVIVNPTDAEWTEYQKLRKRQGPATIFRISRLPEVPPHTADGQPVSIAANLEFPGPADDLLAQKRIPVGLYRTEFLYLQEGRFPDEEEQFQYYERIADTFSDCEVILRTFDIGSDKYVDDGSLPREDNPALGWRGVRSMLGMPDVFKAQIRAILRASTRRNLKIMLPMISDLAEFEKAKKLVHQAMLELRRSRQPFDPDIKLGIMVEVPSAALMADLLAGQVDFVSIGTNDLTQYTMSADRNNGRVADLYTPYHPAVLHLIKLTVDACKRHQKPVSICGEVAGDPLGLPLFVGLGVDQLSMSPTRIFDMCRLVARLDTRLIRLMTSSLLASPSTASVMRKLHAYRAGLEKR